MSLAAWHAAASPSPDDKATARQLATEGIRLYRGAHYADALDRLQRAQALYPAPIHLLYIARCQVKLQKLVEAAETYRKLVKWKLAPNASQVFKDAQVSGRKELSELEPRVPALHLDVAPKSATHLSVTIDGEQVSPAVVGVDRVADPGEHHVEVSAPGYASAEATVRIRAGEKKRVSLVLRPSASAGATNPPSSKLAQPMHVETPAPEPEHKPTWYGFMLGLRLSGAFPEGSVSKDQSGNVVSMSSYAGRGGSLELHGGVRLWKYFTPVLLFQGTSLTAGSANGAQSVNAQSFGIGVIIGSKRNRFGGFGELDVLPYERYASTQTLSVASQHCTESQVLTDAGVRIGGGAVLPISNFLHITPFILATAAAFSNRSLDVTSGQCPSGASPPSGSIASGDQRVHTLVFVGVGGDYIFGDDAPSK